MRYRAALAIGVRSGLRDPVALPRVPLLWGSGVIPSWATLNKYAPYWGAGALMAVGAAAMEVRVVRGEDFPFSFLTRLGT